MKIGLQFIRIIAEAIFCKIEGKHKKINFVCISWTLKICFSVEKMTVLVDHVLKIKAKFNEDRKKPSLNFNDEQIHKYDK